jgi:hypothetical protein
VKLHRCWPLSKERQSKTNRINRPSDHFVTILYGNDFNEFYLKDTNFAPLCDGRII